MILPPVAVPSIVPRNEEIAEERLRDQERAIIAEIARRRIESLALYEPLPEQQRFHRSRAQIRLARGSNRSGKTLVTGVEVARAVTGKDPHLKYPLTDGRVYAVGKDGKHCGEVLYRKLFKSQPFFIIRDLVTRLWRAYRPNDEGDRWRKHERKPAPPLIPGRYVKEIAWENKKANVPSIVRLTTGWEITFYSSLGKPPQGGDVDLVWFDEEIIDPAWVPEMKARLLDRGGKIIWSATPQAGTEHLFELHVQADAEALMIDSEDERQVCEYLLLLRDNAFIEEKAKADFAKSLSEEERAVRVEGDFAIDSLKVYPEYRPEFHTCEWFEIPRHWTRYAFVDPGRQVCGVLFLAVPPPSEDRHIYIYDELYIKDADARKFAKSVRDRQKEYPLEAWWMDMHEGRKKETGSGLTIARQYATALQKQAIRSVQTGYDFYAAPDDVKSGIEAFRGWLVLDEQGNRRLRIFDTCRHLDRELRRYHYKRDPKTGLPLDEPIKKFDHLCDCCRYAAAVDPPYVKPRKASSTPRGVLTLLDERRKLDGKGRDRGRVNIGPNK